MINRKLNYHSVHECRQEYRNRPAECETRGSSLVFIHTAPSIRPTLQRSQVRVRPGLWKAETVHYSSLNCNVLLSLLPTFPIFPRIPPAVLPARCSRGLARYLPAKATVFRFVPQVCVLSILIPSKTVLALWAGVCSSRKWLRGNTMKGMEKVPDSSCGGWSTVCRSLLPPSGRTGMPPMALKTMPPVPDPPCPSPFPACLASATLSGHAGLV